MESRTQRPYLMAVLEEKGYKPTARRRAIASLLEQQNEGFTIEALCKELPSVGRATLYRTIKLFLEVGIVCKVATLDGAGVYSLARLDNHHHHSMCVVCGAVEEFRAAKVEQMVNAISAEFRGEIIDHRFELYVNCGHCPSDDEE